MATNSSMADFIRGLERDVENARNGLQEATDREDAHRQQRVEAAAKLNALEWQLAKARKAAERKKPTREPQAAPRSMPMRNGPVEEKLA
jgi:flagellar biosynthesis chaperone FliJ